MDQSSLPFTLALESLPPDAASLVAGRVVMLGFIALVMLGLLGFVLYLRKMARNPSQEVRDLESLSSTPPENKSDDQEDRGF